MVPCDEDGRVVEAREANFLRRRSVLGISLQRTVSCARQAHIGIGSSVPASVPKHGPRTIIRQPMPPRSQ